jgi:hypothetical protein
MQTEGKINLNDNRLILFVIYRLLATRPDFGGNHGIGFAQFRDQRREAPMPTRTIPSCIWGHPEPDSKNGPTDELLFFKGGVAMR